MARKILALAVALAACGTPGGQTSAPASSPPVMNSAGATGAVSPTPPSGGPVVPSPGYPLLPMYLVPAHPAAYSGDDGRTAGKTNAD